MVSHFSFPQLPKIGTILHWHVVPEVCVYQCCGSARIRIIFLDPDPGSVPECPGSGSGSISYANEHNKMNWKGKYNNYAFCFGPVRPTDKENQVKMYKKYCYR